MTHLLLLPSEVTPSSNALATPCVVSGARPAGDPHSGSEISNSSKGQRLRRLPGWASPGCRTRLKEPPFLKPFLLKKKKRMSMSTWSSHPPKKLPPLAFLTNLPIIQVFLEGTFRSLGRFRGYQTLSRFLSCMSRPGHGPVVCSSACLE